MTNTKNLKKQLMAAVAMLIVAMLALGAASYAWFVSNNSVRATTTNISAQSNSAYLVIDTKSTSKDSTFAATAKGSDTALYPAQWANNFNAQKEDSDTKIYQFESAYASDKDYATEKDGTRFAVGSPSEAVTAGYALLNTFYVGTGTYDGEFTNLKVSNMTVTDTGNTGLKSGMRLLIMAYANGQSDPTSWVVAKYNDGTSASIESQSREGTDGIVYAPAFGKDSGDVKIEVYAYYDGDDSKVNTTNLTNLKVCSATVTFEATAKEFGKGNN